MGNIQKINIENVAKQEFIPYAGQSLINFLPSIDGCLPVHRKIGISMLRRSRLPNKPFIKSVKAMGEIVTYYIYGTSGLYGSMVNMANNNMNIPMLLSKGSWGDKRRKDGYAAAERYTDCKLSQYMVDMMAGLRTKKFISNIVPMKPNFDNTTDEMVVMPSLPPNILLNMSQSISLSEASRIPSFNVIDTCDSIISYIKNNDMKKAISIIKVPDFNFGGQIIYDKEIFDKIYDTGKGSFIILGKYKYNEKKRVVSIYEIPFNTTIDDIEDKLRKAYDNDLFKEIIDIHNGCGKDGIKLDIYLKKNINLNEFILKLRKYTPFESKFSCNFTILDLDWKTPKLMNLQDIFDKWIQHRINCISNELIFEINKNKEHLHELEGLQIILPTINDVINTIRQSKNKDNAIGFLQSKYSLDKNQSEYIAKIQLINLNQEYIINEINNINKLKINIEQLENILHSDKLIKDKIISQLEYCKNKYGKPRMTDIIYPQQIKDISNINVIEEYSTYCTISKYGYLHKLRKKSDSVKLKDEDYIINELYSNNADTLLLFSNKGNCYKLYEYELDEDKPSKLGQYLPSLLDMEKDEEIITMVTTNKYIGDIIEIFENGKIARIPLESFKTETKRTKLKNSLYLDNGRLIDLFVINKDMDILLQTNINKILIANTSIINSKKSKNTSGIQIMKMKNDSHVILGIPLEQLNIEKIEDINYYKNNTGKGIGVFLKKNDIIEKNSLQYKYYVY